jgi:Tol biopolymer transport system component
MDDAALEFARRPPTRVASRSSRVASCRHRACRCCRTRLLALAVGGYLLASDSSSPARGELIAYSCKEPKSPWYAIFTIRSDGTENRRLTSHLPTSDPAWSPDGRKIAFTRREDVGDYTTLSEDDVFVMDSDGGGERQLTREVEGQHSGQPSWPPDGRAIVFTRRASVPTEFIVRPGCLHVMNADGSDVRRLTQGSLDGGGIWPPDGQEVAFSRSEGFNEDDPSREIWVVAAAVGEPRQLTRTVDSFDPSPAWSPDGVASHSHAFVLRASSTAPRRSGS